MIKPFSNLIYKKKDKNFPSSKNKLKKEENIKSNLLRLKGGLIGGLFALILISGIFASSTIALGSLFYAYRLKKNSNSDDNQMQDLETVNV